MTTKSKMSLKEKEQHLIQKIENAKKDLLRLQQKRRTELGKLACKHGLDQYDDAVLDTRFEQLAQALAHDNS